MNRTAPFFRRPRLRPALALRLAGPLCLAAAAGAAWPAPQDGPPPAAGHACLMEPFQKIELRSPVEATIAAVHVDRGAWVKKGQVLVDLDSAAERAALEAARYRAVMEGPVRTAQSRLEAAREKFARRDEMSKEHFIARQDRDDARTDVRVAEAALVEADENRRLAVLEQRKLAELVEQRKLRAPFNGVVTERLQQVGELAQTGEGARPILRLAQTHPLRVEVVLPVAMLGRVKTGMRGEVSLEAPLSGRHAALVTVVDRVVDSASGTFGVRLELPNPNGELPAGVKCRVRFEG